MNVSLCLEMIFGELPFLDRIEAAHRLGFDTFEFWSWKDKPCDEVAARAASCRMRIGAFSGNRLHGLWTSADPQPLINEVHESLAAARRMNGSWLMLLACPLRPDGSAIAPPVGLSCADRDNRAVETLRTLAAVAASFEVCLLLEPLNTCLDHPGYYPDRSAPAFEWVRAVSSPYLRVLYDVYHMFMMGEDVIKEISDNLEWIGQLHVADAPGRHEPGTGKISYPAIAALLRERNYGGMVGLEFSAAADDVSAAQTALRFFEP
jgi:hydroxypyruvate isomerase